MTIVGGVFTVSGTGPSRLLPVRRAGFSTLKLDAVITRGDNDDELVELLEFARSVNAELRYIEYMDVGGATRWSPDRVFSRREILDTIAARHGGIEPIVEESSAPADRFRLNDGTTFGIIASTTQPFCRLCDRSRLTADGMWYLCLYATHGLDLRAALRGGASPEARGAAAKIGQLHGARGRKPGHARRLAGAATL